MNEDKITDSGYREVWTQFAVAALQGICTIRTEDVEFETGYNYTVWAAEQADLMLKEYLKRFPGGKT